MKIDNSLDWPNLKSELQHTVLSKIAHPTHRMQVLRMIGNIQFAVDDLSRAEVLARRGNKTKATELLVQVNNDIETVEEFILVAALIG